MHFSAWTISGVAVEKWKDQSLRIYSVLPDGTTGVPNTSPFKMQKTDVVKAFYFLRKRRTCDEVELCRVDSRTGEVKVLIHEVSKPYFNEDFFHLSFLN
ncbi:MAG: hypothetical protein ACLUDU_00300 [Butyricimonas faecihominis]